MYLCIYLYAYMYTLACMCIYIYVYVSMYIQCLRHFDICIIHSHVCVSSYHTHKTHTHHRITLQYSTVNHIAWYVFKIPSHFTALHCTTLHYVAIDCIAMQYMTLSYIFHLTSLYMIWDCLIILHIYIRVTEIHKNLVVIFGMSDVKVFMEYKSFMCICRYSCV